jgi:NADH-quinone oxidoreductase subunit H
MSTKANNLNLLSTYHPKNAYYKRSALAQVFKFALLAIVWLTLIFSAAAGAAVTFAWVLPEIIMNITPLFWKTDASTYKLIADIHAYLAPIVTVATVIPVNALFMVLCERKFLALLTMRIGPDKIGPNGGLQTLADAFKLLFKEDTTPSGADKLLFTLAPALFFAPSMIVFLPLLAVAGNKVGAFAYTDLDISVIFILGFVSLGTMSLVMAGWASNNKYSLIGGLRAAAQAVSYEIPLVLAMISIILVSGSMNLVKIANDQIGGIIHWNVLGHGQLVNVSNIFASSGGQFWLGFSSLLFVFLCFTLFVIFIIASTAEVNRIPFDIPEAESELVSGFNTEYSGMKFALFFLAEYTNLFIASGVAAILFLGGGHLPVDANTEMEIMNALSSVTLDLPVIGTLDGVLANLNFTWVITGITLLVKVYFLFFLSIWIRATLPRLRPDQLMEFSWKYLIPITLLIIFTITVILEYLHI